MKILAFISLFILSSCNVYELVDQGNKVSDEFDELISSPQLHQDIFELSTSQVNLAGSGGINFFITLKNGSFPDPLPTSIKLSYDTGEILNLSNTSGFISPVRVNSKTISFLIKRNMSDIDLDTKNEDFISLDSLTEGTDYFSDNGKELINNGVSLRIYK